MTRLALVLLLHCLLAGGAAAQAQDEPKTIRDRLKHELALQNMALLVTLENKIALAEGTLSVWLLPSEFMLIRAAHKGYDPTEADLIKRLRARQRLKYDVEVWTVPPAGAHPQFGNALIVALGMAWRGNRSKVEQARVMDRIVRDLRLVREDGGWKLLARRSRLDYTRGGVDLIFAVSNKLEDRPFLTPTARRLDIRIGEGKQAPAVRLALPLALPRRPPLISRYFGAASGQLSFEPPPARDLIKRFEGGKDRDGWQQDLLAEALFASSADPAVARWLGDGKRPQTPGWIYHQRHARDAGTARRLMDLVAEGEWKYASIAALALGKSMAPLSEERLLGLLASRDPTRRYLALRVCSARQVAAAEPAALRLLQDSHPEVRARAWRLLGEVGKLNPAIVSEALRRWRKTTQAGAYHSLAKMLGRKEVLCDAALLAELSRTKLWKRRMGLAHVLRQRATQASMTGLLTMLAGVRDKTRRDQLLSLIFSERGLWRIAERVIAYYFELGPSDEAISLLRWAKHMRTAAFVRAIGRRKADALDADGRAALVLLRQRLGYPVLLDALLTHDREFWFRQALPQIGGLGPAQVRQAASRTLKSSRKTQRVFLWQVLQAEIDQPFVLAVVKKLGTRKDDELKKLARWILDPQSYEAHQQKQRAEEAERWRRMMENAIGMGGGREAYPPKMQRPSWLQPKGKK